MSWKTIRLIAALVSICGLALGSAAANAQTNYLTDLGAVAPALGINNSGEVVLQNYIYSHGTLTAFPDGFTGNAINASGEVAGSMPAPPADPYFQVVAAVYSNGTVTAIPATSFFAAPLNPVGACYFGTGINDSGSVVGWYDIYCTTIYSSQPPGGWVYSGSTVTSIGGGCDGGSVAQAINDSGQITGWSSFCPNGQQDAFLYGNSPSGNDKIAALGTGGAGFAINASGQVAGGQSLGATSTGGFLYSNGHVTLLPGRAGIGYAINASGLIVGDDVNGQPHAYLYNGATTVDLNTLVSSTDPLKPYVTLADARGINDSGLVVVNGVDSRDNSNHAYLLQVPSIKIAPSKSGGGAFDSLSLMFLVGILALRCILCGKTAFTKPALALKVGSGHVSQTPRSRFSKSATSDALNQPSRNVTA